MPDLKPFVVLKLNLFVKNLVFFLLRFWKLKNKVFVLICDGIQRDNFLSNCING